MKSASFTAASRRRTLTMAGVAVAAAATGAAVGWRRWALGELPPDPVAAAFLQQPFQTPEGAQLSLGALDARLLLVNFWAPWCAPCVEELPMLDAFYAAQHSQGWQLVGLAVDQPAAVSRFLRHTPLSFPVALAGLAGIQLSRQLGNEAGGLPFSVLFDRSGRIRQRKLGQLSRAELDEWARASA